MKTSQPSRSAGIVAAHRIIESSKPEEERVCYDPMAGAFLPDGFTVIGPHEMAQEDALNIFKALVPGFHEFFIARTRYMDDFLDDCIKKGLEQLVVLGAGYDSRAYRFEALKEIPTFEVDHPATQNIKKEKVFNALGMLPPHVRFVPVDFNKERLRSGLVAKGYDRQLKTLFIWEGVTMYIDSDAIEETLAFMAENTGDPSWLIFDYTYPEVIDGTYDRKEAKEWLKIAQNSAEPLRYGFSRENLETFLMPRGFSNVVTISGDDLNEMYFTGPNSGRESTPVLSIASAQIGTG